MQQIGAGATAFAVDPAAVRAAAQVLCTSAETMRNGRRYGAVTGLGEAAELVRAAEEFRTGWDAELTRWQESLTRFAQAVDQSGVLLSAGDDAQAAVWTGIAGELP